ncbi:MAG: FAD-dependent oxidoreductase [Dehalococcoidia bacterium]
MKVCIIGGGAGGRSASGRIRQLDKEAQIEIFTKQSEVGYAPCELPFVLRGNIVTWEDIFYPGDFFKEGQINLHVDTEVTDILREEKRIIAEGKSYAYDKAILSLGAIPSIPPIPGLDGRNEFTLSTNIADARTLGAVIPMYASAAVIGAGAIGIEITLALMAKGYRSLYLLDIMENILPASLDKDMTGRVEGVLRQKGVELILPAMINSIRSESARKRLILPGRELEVDFIFFATGVKPNVELARKEGLQIGSTGAIAVNQYLQTSDPDIYAVGDCMENWDVIMGSKTRRLMVTTAGITGEVAATNLVLGNTIPYQGTTMTFIIEIFGYQVGSVGFTERLAREKGLDVVSHITTTLSTRPKYGREPIYCKLIAERGAGNLVGAQVISEAPIRGAIDELALAIECKIPLDKLAQLDTPYSPAIGGDQVRWAVRELMNKTNG